ncbi:hypothetical protein AAKU55_001827 [Oxalobacteraceae bacterium GrIS 1.11]
MKKIYTVLLMGMAAAGFAARAGAASSEAKAAYNAANDLASANYKAARVRCNAITGNPKDVCVAEAKALRVHAEADASAQYKNTLGTFTKARTQIADANYDVDKARCEARTGNEKDVCIKQAKSTRVAALADAKADKKVIEARSNAREDKRSAEYKVATERCDALAGPAKDNCVQAAKTQFGY